MFIINSYSLAVFFTVITMFCWGSWANTQKLAGKTWRFELFYWDYVIGILLFTLILGFTLGSIGSQGRSFLTDIAQAETKYMLSPILGGIVFNLANILVAAAIALAGMSVAFPVGIGIAMVLGVFINYITKPYGNPVLLFLGVALVTVAIVIDAIAYKKISATSQKPKSKAILYSIIGGVLMASFYRFVSFSMDLDNFENPIEGKLTAYSGVFFFAIGIFISNFIFNTWFMKNPVEGSPVSYKDYFSGKISTHLVGILGGMIWAIGTSFSFLAAGKASPAISYGLGQGATMIAAAWGVFIWNEFKGANKITNQLIALMFALFIGGLVLIVYAGM